MSSSPTAEGVNPAGAVIAQLLPGGVAAAEAWGDRLGETPPPLWPGEEAGIAGVSSVTRGSSYRWGRALARAAMQDLGHDPAAVGHGASRQPLWPVGLTGSLTHCRGYCAAAVAESADWRAVGIDAELVRPLAAGVIRRIATSEEQERLAALAPRERDLGAIALFSAKESLYKAWFAVTGRWLGFQQAVVEFPDWRDRTASGASAEGRFLARLTAPGPEGALGLPAVLEGRCAVRDTFVATALAVRSG